MDINASYQNSFLCFKVVAVLVYKVLIKKFNNVAAIKKKLLLKVLAGNLILEIKHNLFVSFF